MKPSLSSPQRGESGLLDLFVMVIAVALVAALFLPMLAKRRAHGSRINCANNQKQIGLSFLLCAGDNNDKMPMQVSTNLGGTMEFVASGNVFPHFAVMSNELGTTRIIVCPEDAKRRAGTNFDSLSDSNISFFIAPEASHGIPALWLCGDRNLATNNVLLKPGLFTMPTNRVFSWTTELHVKKGYLCLADGSVQVSDGDGTVLPNVRLQQSVTNTLRAWLATTNAPFQLAIP